MAVLTPHSFVTLEQGLEHFKRSGQSSGQETDIVERVTAALNRASGWLESLQGAGRKLRLRSYRTVTTATVAATANSKTLTGTGLTTKAYVGDAAANAALASGSRVVAVASAGTSVTLDRPAASADAAAVVSFGSAGLGFDGEDWWADHELYLPEAPVLDVWSVSYRNDDGSVTALDLTGIRIDPDEKTGRVVLPNDSIPHGDQNLVAEFRAGYPDPENEGWTYWTAWHDLQRIALRAADVFFLDERDLRGRSTDLGLQNLSSRFADFQMPSDLENAIKAYRRLA